MCRGAVFTCKLAMVVVFTWFEGLESKPSGNMRASRWIWFAVFHGLDNCLHMAWVEWPRVGILPLGAYLKTERRPCIADGRCPEKAYPPDIHSYAGVLEEDLTERE